MNTPPPTTDRIDTADEAALHDWARRLDTTAQQLRDAVAAVGDHAGDVEMHLKGSRASSNADEEARGEQAPPAR